ncbi:hypothetical protein [Isoptericola aurantiacus]|uniref:hypothetical protein n=1 Tax=Isoptericola aurantiacus TaxID=3377839 RepID=UPI00383B0A9B
MTDDTSSQDRDAIPVAALPEVGSEPLAAALEAQDVPAIGQALRHDFVVVPILRPSDGETQNRVFAAPEGAARPYLLCLFSSAQTLAAFLTPQAPDREFALRRGDTLVPFLDQHAEVIERVVFDPAGPHPVSATPEDVLLALAPQPGDDDAAWVAGALSGDAPTDAPDEGADIVVPLPELGPDDTDAIGGARAVGFDLNLPRQWAVLELDDAGRRRQQIRRLVKKQTTVLGDRGAGLRREMREWLERTGAQASSGGGRLLAFLLQRTDDAALALSLALYWHDLGPQIGGRPHLLGIADRIRKSMGERDTLVGSATAAGSFLRHAHVTRGAAEVGGQDLEVLVLDYWLAAPGDRGVVELSFSTPHLDARDAVTLLADNVVIATAWVVEGSEESDA